MQAKAGIYMNWLWYIDVCIAVCIYNECEALPNIHRQHVAESVDFYFGSPFYAFAATLACEPFSDVVLAIGN